MNIQIAHKGPIAIVTLNRPERRNALSLELMLDLIAALDDIGRNCETAPSSSPPPGMSFAPATISARWPAATSMNTAASSTSAPA